MEKIYIKKGKEVLFIDLNCVYVIESVGNYAMFYYMVNGVSNRGSVLNTLNNKLKGVSVIGVKKVINKNTNKEYVSVLDKIMKGIKSLFSRRESHHFYTYCP